MSAVRTWADGFGRWYAEVPIGPDAEREAREAIGHELDIRGDRGPAYRVDVERVCSFRPMVDRFVYREVIQ